MYLPNSSGQGPCPCTRGAGGWEIHPAKKMVVFLGKNQLSYKKESAKKMNKKGKYTNTKFGGMQWLTLK